MEDFVTYEQAVKLKELGFDWKVRACYRRKLILDFDNPHYTHYTEPKFIHNDTMGKRWTTNYNDNRCGGGTGKYYYSAPTLAQAQKWLREERGIDIVISPRFDSNSGERIGYFWQWRQRTDVSMNPKTHKSYELALSDAISTILKPFENYE